MNDLYSAIIISENLFLHPFDSKNDVTARYFDLPDRVLIQYRDTSLCLALFSSTAMKYLF